MVETRYMVSHANQQVWMPDNGVIFDTPSLAHAERWAKDRVRRSPNQPLRISSNQGQGYLATVRTDWQGKVWVDLEPACAALL